MTSAFVTGATGFIGGKLVGRLLAEGQAVHALLRPTSDANLLDPRVTVHRHDGTMGRLIDALSRAKPDMVFHLASLYLADHKSHQVEPLILSNVFFPAQLAEAMAATGARRLINTGTAWQHFETSEYRPVNLYAATKQACQDLLRYYQDAQGLSVLTLKLFDTYGLGDNRRKLVNLLVDAASSGGGLGMSPGEQIVDLTHVDDVVEAFMLAAARLMERPASEESFFVSGERLSVRDLVSEVEAALGMSVHAEFGKRPYRMREVMTHPELSVGSLLPGWQRQRDVKSYVRSMSVAAPVRAAEEQ
jgi:nucleoside-diphosphate-sugar epimerase